MGPMWGGGSPFNSGDSSRMMFVHQETASLKVADVLCFYGCNIQIHGADGDCGDPLPFTAV